MEQLLIVGIDSVVGANLAAHLADKFHVVGISGSAPVSIEGCETTLARTDDPHAAGQIVAAYRPDRVVVCTVAGDSPWHQAGTKIAEPAAITSATAWIRSVRDLRAGMTLISSDAIFSGPWMFHTETSTSFCQSPAAVSLRALEAGMLEERPGSLIVRTHAYGWNPLSDRPGWVEGILAALDSDQPAVFDCVSHATPILATDLADVLCQAWGAGLSGVYHIAGAERTNPHRFVRTLAGIFDLAPPRAAILSPPDVVSAEFARGETSLHTRAIRRALGVSMPILVDGLQRLCDQRNNGFDRRFHGSRPTASSKVA